MQAVTHTRRLLTVGSPGKCATATSVPMGYGKQCFMAIFPGRARARMSCHALSKDKQVKFDAIKPLLLSELKLLEGEAAAWDPSEKECAKLASRSTEFVSSWLQSSKDVIASEQVHRLLIKIPGTALACAPDTLHAKLLVLKDLLGTSFEEAVSVAIKTPLLLERSPETLKARMEALVGLVGSKQLALKVATLTPGVLANEANTLAFKYKAFSEAAAAYQPWAQEMEEENASKLGFVLTRGVDAVLRLKYLEVQGFQRRYKLRTVVGYSSEVWNSHHPDFAAWLTTLEGLPGRSSRIAGAPRAPPGKRVRPPKPPAVQQGQEAVAAAADPLKPKRQIRRILNPYAQKQSTVTPPEPAPSMQSGAEKPASEVYGDTAPAVAPEAKPARKPVRILGVSRAKNHGVVEPLPPPETPTQLKPSEAVTPVPEAVTPVPEAVAPVSEAVAPVPEAVAPVPEASGEKAMEEAPRIARKGRPIATRQPEPTELSQ